MSLRRKPLQGENEIVLLQKTAKYWNQQDMWDRPDGIILITDQHLVFRTQVPTRAAVLSFPLEQIQNLETTRVMFISPAIRFEFEGQIYMFTFFANAGAVVKAVNTARQAES